MDLSQIQVGSTTYDIKDTTARTRMLPTSITDSSVTSTSTIHIGTSDPSTVSTNSWSIGDLYIYVKNS